MNVSRWPLHVLPNHKFNIFIVLNFISFLCKTNFILCENAEQIHSKHPGDGKKFGASGPFINCDEIKDELATKIFFDTYVKEKKPLIMRNFVKNYPALKLWTDEYLSDMAKGHDDYKLTIETLKKESRHQQIVEMTLREFMASYKKMDIYMVNEVPSFLKKDVLLPQP